MVISLAGQTALTKCFSSRSLLKPLLEARRDWPTGSQVLRLKVFLATHVPHVNFNHVNKIEAR